MNQLIHKQDNITQTDIDNINNLYNIIPKLKTKIDDFISSDKENLTEIEEIKDIVFGLLNKSAETKKYYEKEELKNPKSNIVYNIYVFHKDHEEKLFCLFLILYYYESCLRYKLVDAKKSPELKCNYVGIDCEFAKGKLELMQLNFETHPKESDKETLSHIFIISPRRIFSQTNQDYLINLIMINKHIIKIFHGPDSQDIPYIYNDLLKGDKELIKLFTSRMVDTKILCEFTRYGIDMTKFCTIYETMNYFDVIKEEKYKYLDENKTYMGPIQDHLWDIERLGSFDLYYALYDVIMLKHILNNIYEKTQSLLPNLVNSYKYIIHLTQFIYTERRDVTQISTMAKQLIDPVHNFLIKSKGENVTLIKIYKDIIGQNLVIENIEIPLNNLLSINYFREGLQNIFKLIVYSIIVDNYPVKQNKNTFYTDKIYLSKFYNEMKDNGHEKIVPLFMNFYETCLKFVLSNY